MGETAHAATTIQSTSETLLPSTVSESKNGSSELAATDSANTSENNSLLNLVTNPLILAQNLNKLSFSMNKPVAVSIGWAIGSTAVATLLIYMVAHVTTGMLPFFLYIAAVTVSAWRGGSSGGFIATCLSGLLLSYFFLSPTALVGSILTVGQFFLVGVLISVIVDVSTNAQRIKHLKYQTVGYSHMVASLRKQLEHAQKEVTARDEFLSIASHELKTPLTSMLLQLQIALHNIRNVSLANFSAEGLMKMLQSAEDQTTRLSRMINDLLNVSLITTGKLDLNREEIDLAEVVKSVFDNFSEKLVQEGYHVNLLLAEDVVGMWDKVRIEQVVTNLLSNAIKYGDHKPITITLLRKDGRALLTVQDQGIGIHEDNQNRIFARFERGVSAADYKGLGVGLYITRQIIQAHGGTITVKSKLGKGSTFIIQLPLKVS